MSDDKNNDLFGLKPYGEAIKIATKGAVDSAAAFLGRICLPAAEEFGLLLRDKVHAWRTKNVIAITQFAGQYLGNSTNHAHPRLISSIIEKGSWIDDSYVQNMWAGLLATSCTKDGEDDSNLLFVNLLSDMTKAQARMLSYICEHAEKYMSRNGLPAARELQIDLDTLKRISGVDDVFRLDRELDYLRGQELIGGGFMLDSSSTNAQVIPSPIALNMYVRCHGSRKSPIEFFNLTIPEEMPPKGDGQQTTEKAT